MVALDHGVGLYHPQGRHVLDLLLDPDWFEHHLFSGVDLGQAEEVFAFDVGQPYDFAVTEVFFFFFVGGVIVELEFAAEAEPQIELHGSLVLLDHDHSLARLGVLGRKIDFFIELDLGGDLGLVLVAGVYFKVLFVSSQHQPVLHLLLVLLVHRQSQVLLRYLVPQVDRLVVFDRHVELHVVPVDLHVK